MISGIRLKICGLTSLVDADAADAVGADFLGFVFYPKSPRNVPVAQYRAMQDWLPPRKKVAVSVGPTAADLTIQAELGFDFFQVHFDPLTPAEIVASWVGAVGVARLWLAPRLPPGIDVYPALLPLAETFLLDTFHAEKMGGTGETGDWAKFRQHREKYPDKRWVLSGGLKPQNVPGAVTATGARFIDVNSGVELAPGIKDPAKLQALARALQSGAGFD